MKEPVKMKWSLMQTGQDYECYFCNVVIDDPEGIIYYRAKTSFRWESVPVCEQCYYVAEEVRGWFE
tara:strand:+ start:4848 stop:5045 length:198 start_codon:yes stop_codon:yes gene_type:complete